MYIIDKHAYKSRNMLETPENTHKFRIFTCLSPRQNPGPTERVYHPHVSWLFPHLTSLSRVEILVPGTIIPSQKSHVKLSANTNAKKTHKHVYIYI